MLTIHWDEVIYTIINLLILSFALRKFLFRPVMDLIERRQKEIRNNLEASADQRIKAETILHEYESKLSIAKEEANGLLEKARRDSDAESRVRMFALQEAIGREREEASRAMEVERQEMLASVRREVTGLALLTTEKLTARKPDAEAEAQLLDEFLKRAGDTP